MALAVAVRGGCKRVGVGVPGATAAATGGRSHHSEMDVDAAASGLLGGWLLPAAAAAHTGTVAGHAVSIRNSSTDTAAGNKQRACRRGKRRSASRH